MEVLFAATVDSVDGRDVIGSDAEVFDVKVGSAVFASVVEEVVAGSEPVVNPSGVSSVAVCPWQTHCSQSVVA